MITPGTEAIAAHQPLATAKPAVDHELAREDGDDPHGSAVTHVATRVAVAEVGDLATQLVVGIGVEPAEARRGRAPPRSRT